MDVRFSKFKTLSGKVLTAISIAFVLLFLGQWSIARFIISNSYYRLEEEQTSIDAERLTQIISQEVNNLAINSRDWAWWSDTYKFSQDGNQAFIDKQLKTDTLAILSLDFFVIANLDHEVVFGQMLDPEAEELVDLSPK